MELPLGSGTIEATFPDCNVTVVEPSGREPVDVRAGAERALADPHGPPLESRVDPTDEVAIVVTDVTRKVPDDVLLSALLERLADHGVARSQITVVIGLGLHRPMADDEIETMLGAHADLAVNHDPNSVVEIGSVSGCSVEIGATVAEADTILSTGVVEPHQYAGFSGGAKTVVIGAGSESLIRYTHGPETVSRDGVRLGRTEGNRFREILDQAGDLAGVDFCLNLTHGPDGVLGVAAGDHRAVVDDLASVARDALSVPVDEEFDVVVCGVGAPKDANLYQTTRAGTYVALGDRNPLRPGGTLVIPAALPEGAGEGAGERRFYDRLSNATDADSLYETMREGYEPGAQRAFVVARVLREYDCVVTNSQCPEIVESTLLSAQPDVEDPVDPGEDVLVVPDALNTLLVDG